MISTITLLIKKLAIAVAYERSDWLTSCETRRFLHRVTLNDFE